MDTIKLFGDWRGAPIADDCPFIDPPVGEVCIHCGEPIDAGDAGMRYSNGPVAHYECQLRGVVGGVNHILGRCTCCGGEEDPDPPGMTRRQAAQAAVRLYERRGFG